MCNKYGDNPICDTIELFSEFHQNNLYLKLLKNIVKFKKFDIILCAENNHFPLHKALLTSISSIFAEWLYKFPGITKIYLPNFTGEDISNILHLLYYGKVKVRNFKKYLIKFNNIINVLEINNFNFKEKPSSKYVIKSINRDQNLKPNTIEFEFNLKNINHEPQIILTTEAIDWHNDLYRLISNNEYLRYSNKSDGHPYFVYNLWQMYHDNDAPTVYFTNDVHGNVMDSCIENFDNSINDCSIIDIENIVEETSNNHYDNIIIMNDAESGKVDKNETHLTVELNNQNMETKKNITSIELSKWLIQETDFVELQKSGKSKTHAKSKTNEISEIIVDTSMNNDVDATGHENRGNVKEYESIIASKYSEKCLIEEANYKTNTKLTKVDNNEFDTEIRVTVDSNNDLNHVNDIITNELVDEEIAVLENDCHINEQHSIIQNKLTDTNQKDFDNFDTKGFIISESSNNLTKFEYNFDISIPQSSNKSDEFQEKRNSIQLLIDASNVLNGHSFEDALAKNYSTLTNNQNDNIKRQLVDSSHIKTGSKRKQIFYKRFDNDEMNFYENGEQCVNEINKKNIKTLKFEPKITNSYSLSSKVFTSCKKINNSDTNEYLEDFDSENINNLNKNDLFTTKWLTKSNRKRNFMLSSKFNNNTLFSKNANKRFHFDPTSQNDDCDYVNSSVESGIFSANNSLSNVKSDIVNTSDKNVLSVQCDNLDYNSSQGGSILSSSFECQNDEDSIRSDAGSWIDIFSGHSILDPSSMCSPSSPSSISPSQSTTSNINYNDFLNANGDGYVCSICNKTYKTKKTLQVHMKLQCGKEPQFKCPLCPKKAYQKVHIEMHVWGTHKMIGWKYWNKDQPKSSVNCPQINNLATVDNNNVNS